jgi:paraquat-inducible protein B
MSQRANTVVVGTFVLGAIALLVISILMFGSMRIFSQKETFILFFKDSVNGLDVGAPVKLRGVPIGFVTKIMLHYNQGQDTTNIPVLIELDKNKIDTFFRSRSKNAKGDLLDIEINDGLRAQLAYESIVTGILFVELDYFEDATAPRFYQEKFIYKEIPTVSGGSNQFFTSIQDIAKKMDSVLTNLDRGIKEVDFKSVSDAFVDIGKAMTNVNGMLDPNSQFRTELEDAIHNFSEASKAVQNLAGMLEREPSSILSGKAKNANEF